MNTAPGRTSNNGENVLQRWLEISRGFSTLLCILAAFCTTGLLSAPALCLSQPAQPALAAGTNQVPPGPSTPSALPDAPQAQLQQQLSTAVPISQALTQQSIPATAGSALPGTIRGVIEDRDGAVYQGVRVSLTQPSAIQLPERTVMSDANGRFQFAAVPAGEFTLTVSSEGFETQVEHGTLAPGQIEDVPAVTLPFANSTTEVRVNASQAEIAQEQVVEEEHQRVLGVIPNFYVTYVPNAPPLTRRQKFDLAWKSSIDPVSLLSSGFFAGIEQANNDFRGYGQGVEGYGKRFGANYADDFIGNMIGGAILPSLLKQDPRYFYKGTGTTKSRIFYALANSVICKGDNGRWQPNYSGILGGLAAGGISNIYYPASDRNGASLTFENTGLGILGSAAGNIFQEFLVKHLTPRIPNYSASKP